MPLKSDHILVIEEFQISLLRSQRKTLTLEVGSQGIRIRAPQRMAENQIRQFVMSKLAWLRKQTNSMPPPLSPLTLETGTNIQLNGSDIELRVCRSRGQVCLHESRLIIPIIGSHLPLQESVRRKLIGFLKSYAKRQIEEQIAEILPTMEARNKTPQIKIRDYKRRWGSCDHQGNLSFNWRIVQAPIKIQRYVIIHELAHRQVFNHSPRFWQLVAKFDSNWKQHQHWLQRHGRELYRY